MFFQDLIAKLTHFWAERGCIVHQGYDLEVGAGTFNPATFMRSLGPEPYKTVYTEPSRRPQDARYGENPNRLHLFHQLQVIIKPSPDNIQAIYLDSLKAVGIDPAVHDIRFVHDDWESPTLGAWGLGWEVWMDGMEITQFTYFQSIGGFELPAIPVEITYGLERLCMYLQGVDSIFQVRWNSSLTFEDLSKQGEREWSRYGFEEAEASMWLRHFNDFEGEARRLIQLHLPLPAYDFVMKASHAFNILEARGKLSVTERTGYITRIRELAHLAAKEYLSIREKMQYPLYQPLPAPPPFAYEGPKTHSFTPGTTHSFLLEIGSEELPATYIAPALLSLERGIKTFFDKQGLSYGDIHLFGTPRRLALCVDKVSSGTEAEKCRRKGPAVDKVFDSKGSPTLEGQGFLKSCKCPGVRLAEIIQGKYPAFSVEEGHLIFHQTTQPLATIDLLKAALPSLITATYFPKTMRWGLKKSRYARPIHWLVALFGMEIIPFELEGIVAGRITYGHRQRAPEAISLKEAGDYVEKLKTGKVLVSEKERKETILSQLATIEKKEKLQALRTSEVLEEVLFLTEWPELTVGSFDESFLQIPQEILIQEMVHHQRYFPLGTKEGRLHHHFIIAADNTPNSSIVQGNERVLGARLADGKFLYNEDRKIPLETLAEKLQGITFHQELGSMADKVLRLKHASDLFAKLVACNPQKLQRAASLCKADLASLLVGEFPALQGVIGRHLAEKQKVPLEIAIAIEEHYFPRCEKDPCPQSPLSIALALADKCDHLLSVFSIGIRPSSSHDPYALRRHAIAVLRLLLESKLDIDLQMLFMELNPQAPIDDLIPFMMKRLEILLLDYDVEKKEIAATLPGHTNPYDIYLRARTLAAYRGEPVFDKLREVYKRAKGQLGKAVKAQAINPNLLKETAEVALFNHYIAFVPNWQETIANRDYPSAFQMLASFQEPLSHLFDTVRILDEDIALRNNRLALLQAVFSPFDAVMALDRL